MIFATYTDVIFYCIISAILLFGFYQLYRLRNYFNKLSKKDEKRSKSIFTFSLITLSIFLLLFSILLPFLIKNGCVWKEMDKLNEIGDAMGGIMNPFIAIAAVIVTGLAFWAQYQANEVVKDQFGVQQFENHVYKQADIYRDNVARWSKQDKKYGLVFTDRLVAISVLESYNILIDEIIIFYSYWRKKTENRNRPVITSQYLEVLRKQFAYNNTITASTKFYYQWILSEIAYIIIFFGLEDRGRENIKMHLQKCYDNYFIADLTNFFSYKVTKKENDKLYTIFRTQTDIQNVFIVLNKMSIDKLYFNIKKPLSDIVYPFKYYNGTETLFAHHYRHLHSAYKYINDYTQIHYQDRWKIHAKLIRTQMSNAEQILFFLNSICILGRGWELEHTISRLDPKEKELNKRLVTKYDIIKNIPKGDRIKYNIEAFYPDIEWEDIPMNDKNILPGEIYGIRKMFEDKFYNLKHN